jgi:hypothetical protein
MRQTHMAGLWRLIKGTGSHVAELPSETLSLLSDVAQMFSPVRILMLVRTRFWGQSGRPTVVWLR